MHRLSTFEGVIAKNRFSWQFSVALKVNLSRVRVTCTLIDQHVPPLSLHLFCAGLCAVKCHADYQVPLLENLHIYQVYTSCAETARWWKKTHPWHAYPFPLFTQKCVGKDTSMKTCWNGLHMPCAPSLFFSCLNTLFCGPCSVSCGEWYGHNASRSCRTTAKPLSDQRQQESHGFQGTRIMLTVILYRIRMRVLHQCILSLHCLNTAQWNGKNYRSQGHIHEFSEQLSPTLILIIVLHTCMAPSSWCSKLY